MNFQDLKETTMRGSSSDMVHCIYICICSVIEGTSCIRARQGTVALRFLLYCTCAWTSLAVSSTPNLEAS